MKQFYTYSLARYYFEESIKSEKNQRLYLRISGPAGTGKSMLLKCIIRLARELFIPDQYTGTDAPVVIGAWSGIAAFNCGGPTLSSTFCTKSNADTIKNNVWYKTNSH